MLKASVKHKIPFHDVDILQIAWHGHYYKYLELARTELMQSVGLDWPALKDLGVSMPVVESSAKYRNALLYDQNIIITAEIKVFDLAELIIHYEIKDEKTSKLHTVGRTRQIYWDIDAGVSLYEVPSTVYKHFKEAQTC